jgi:SAM-dependent methyltransferase
MCLACIDTQKAEAFAERMVGILNGGALALMTSVGHRTGLFDVLAARGPATSAELAQRASLNERYVREWLGAMLTGGIVTHDPESRRYTLPAEHAAFLTRSASPDNLAVTAQFIGEMGAVESDIVACFRKGGGVPYERYGRFHEVMADESNQTVVAGLDEHILPLVPGLVARLSAGIDVLDVGCGSGGAMNYLAPRFPESRFFGYDFSPEAISNARRGAAANPRGHARFTVQDVAAMDEAARYDLITAFDAIHDQAHPDRVLAAIHRALRPGGVFLMQDIKGRTAHHENIGNPIAPLLYTVSCMHCMTVSLANDGAGLGAMWGREKAEEMLRDAGFARVDVHELDHDIQNYWYVVRKD